MDDYLIRSVSEDGMISALAAVTTHTVESARQRHGTAPTATAALGRTLTAAGMLGATLKTGQSVMVRVLGDGPLGGLLATGDAAGAVRGYVANPGVHLPLTPSGKLDVGRAVGRGTLHVTIDMGMRDPYHGCVPLVSGEIAEDIASYLVGSHQIPSLVALGVMVSRQEQVIAAGGLMIQLLPGADEEITAYLEERASVLPTITTMISGGRTPEEIVGVALGELHGTVVDRRTVEFRCGCSIRKVHDVLVSLGEKELRDILAEQGQVEVRCNFCGAAYLLRAPDVEDLIANFSRREEVPDSGN